GGRVVQRRDHGDEAVFHGDFHADAAEFTAGGDLQVVEFIRGQVGGMRVQVEQHAANGGFQQGAVVDFLDVGAADALHHLGEHAQFGDRDVLLPGQGIQA